MRKIIAISIAALLFFSCEKQPFDYRTKYIGDYDFVIYDVYIDPDCATNNGINNCKTITETIYQGSIIYVGEGNEISVRYREGGGWVFHAILNKDGSFTANPSHDWRINGKLNEIGEIEFHISYKHWFIYQDIKGMKLD
jgi:hypothetical protein